MNATRSGQKRPASLAELRELQAKRSQKSASPVLSGPVLPSKPRIEKENTSNPALDRAEREGVTTFRGLFSTDASAADPVRDGVPRAQTFTGTQNASTLPIGGIDSGGGFRSFAMLSRNSGSATQPVQKRTKPRNPFDQRSISASSIPRTSHSKDPFQILDDLSNPGGGDGENGGERDDGAISFKGALEGLSKNERNLNSADIVAPEPREPFPLRGQGKSLERTNSCPPFFAALSASRPPIEFPELSTEQAALPRVLPRRNTSGRLTAALAIPGARRDSGNREDVLSTLRSIDQEHAVRSGKFGMNPPPEVIHLFWPSPAERTNHCPC